MGGRRKRPLRPAAEKIEGKGPLSALTTGLVSSGPSPVVLLARALQADGSGGGAGAPSAYPTGPPTRANAPLQGAGTPTPRELARETFRAGFGGPFSGGPGRFSDQSHVE